MRGLACVLMFQTHCYNSWLTPEARKSALYGWSQLGGTLSRATVHFSLRNLFRASHGETSGKRGRRAPRSRRRRFCAAPRFIGLGMLFRIQEFVLGYPLSPWTDLFRVDVLNILGISMMLDGRALLAHRFQITRAIAIRLRAFLDGSCRATKESGTWRSRAILSALGAAAIIVLVTPLCGRPAASVGLRGRSNPISMASTSSEDRNLGFSPFSLGLRSRSPVWR